MTPERRAVVTRFIVAAQAEPEFPLIRIDFEYFFVPYNTPTEGVLDSVPVQELALVLPAYLSLDLIQDLAMTLSPLLKPKDE